MTEAERKSLLFLREPRHVVGALRLFVFGGLVALGCSSPPVQPFLFWFVTMIYGVTVLGYLGAHNREFHLTRVRYMVFLFDVLIVCALIVLRGREVQGLVMAYSTLLIMAALLVGIGNALLNALIVSALYTVGTAWGAPPEELLTFHHLGPVGFFFVIAVFMGHVAAEARPARRRGAARYAHALGETATKLRLSTVQLREARESLRANERLFTLGMLSAGIAHEIKNPVAAILGSVEEAPGILDDLQQAIREGQETDGLLGELRGVAEDCGHAGEQLRRISRDLSDLVRGGHSQARALEPEESLQGVARMMRTAAGDDVRIEVSSTAEQQVCVDPGRLMQVLLNLAGNAIDAMRTLRGGTLRLAAEDVEHTGRVAFIVRDEGPGIPPEVQQRMYDPFFTTKGPGKGTGLGLHLVSEIVNAQGGTITCESSVGEGATFRVELPAVSTQSVGDGDDVGDDQDASDRGRRGDDSPGLGADAAA